MVVPDSGSTKGGGGPGGQPPLLAMVRLLWGPLDGQMIPVGVRSTRVVLPWPPDVKKPRGAVYQLRVVDLAKGDGSSAEAGRFVFSGWARSA